jgi:mono/diheme cytochrome c family protein
MKRSLKSHVLRIGVGGLALLALSLLGVSAGSWVAWAEEPSQSAAPAPTEENAEVKKLENPGEIKKEDQKIESIEKKEEKAETKEGECCKAGDTTPPIELVAKTPKGGLHSPYPDYAKMAKDDPDLVKQFRLPGCNECHGGTGGGGFCPALSQGVWFWGNTDDVLFRLVTLGSAELEKSGFERYQYGSVHAPMPPMGFTVPTSDQLWKIIAFIRSINPPGANPPEKLIPGKTGPKE